MNLTRIIEDWVQDHCNHHFMTYGWMYTESYISCACLPERKKFIFAVLNDHILIKSSRPFPSPRDVKLYAANPNFFRKLEFFLEQSCTRRLL